MAISTSDGGATWILGNTSWPIDPYWVLNASNPATAGDVLDGLRAELQPALDLSLALFNRRRQNLRECNHGCQRKLRGIWQGPQSRDAGLLPSWTGHGRNRRRNLPVP